MKSDKVEEEINRELALQVASDTIQRNDFHLKMANNRIKKAIKNIKKQQAK
ncbi:MULTISPECIES: hypothetical protein [unclassified Dysgonomonas]|uniref:hypothetical protein n=1 Tax=unclassified Dysgonomonas TaxID=2630389 RepID=UPI000A5BB67A|nr:MULTISPECIES: hypothetical protein [unclassified Dysgonomonas]MBD8346584.1 hypothetical protein [Dysgonomonas sp. HGC4]MBF0574499.1 hypothetical protein [Dysgonomonas sp. GY617]